VNFAALADLALRHSRAVLAATACIVVLAVAALFWGGRLTAGATAGVESEGAQQLLEREVAYAGDSSFVVLFESPKWPATDPRFDAALRSALAPLRADPRVRSVVAPDDAAAPVALRLRSGSYALAVVALNGDFTTAAALYPAIRAKVQSSELRSAFTGNLAFRADLDAVLERDLIRAELFSLPIALLVLVLVFGSFGAAAMSVGVGALAVFTGIAIVTFLSRFMDMAVYAINVSSLIGLGVAIDYSLFLVSRYRDELATGADRPTALRTALATSGRAIAFSGLAVCGGLGGLLFFQGSFLASMGIAAILVVLLAVLFALTFLPALLVALGPHWDAGRVRLPRFAFLQGFWRGLATRVMRHPVLVLVPTLALMLLLGTPFFRLTMAAADVRTLPVGVEARDAFETMRRAFPTETQTRIVIPVQFPTEPVLDANRLGALYDLSQRLRKMPGVVQVESVADADARMTREQVQAMAAIPDVILPEPILRARAMVVGKHVALVTALLNVPSTSPQAQALVRALRADRQVGDGTLQVTGATAHDMDVTVYILDRARMALTFTMLMMALVLFTLLRSIVLPLKAIAMNLLSICASFGALVWIFQEGHLASWLGFEAAPLDPTLPLLLACTVFGLSMDYEVLLLSRMREEYLRTGDNTQAVAEGLQRTGRLVTSAALIMVAVFTSFAAAHIVVVKAMGVGLALAVLLDATLVRMLIVPATMRLLGDWNWRAPTLRWGKAKPQVQVPVQASK
jgi:RND superfamily putative drug exporter